MLTGVLRSFFGFFRSQPDDPNRPREHVRYPNSSGWPPHAGFPYGEQFGTSLSSGVKIKLHTFTAPGNGFFQPQPVPYGGAAPPNGPYTGAAPQNHFNGHPYMMSGPPPGFYDPFQPGVRPNYYLQAPPPFQPPFYAPPNHPPPNHPLSSVPGQQQSIPVPQSALQRVPEGPTAQREVVTESSETFFNYPTGSVHREAISGKEENWWNYSNHSSVDSSGFTQADRRGLYIYEVLVHRAPASSVL
ncbi:hypothetical protein DFH06DRAFT_1143224 [Mycena polygramma]|nr:hypothetical protein DFH06DRAFT_1143224 [Mycena polygramma]